MDIWSIGHWIHPQDVFIELLQSNGVQCLADVRRFPGSRTTPHFSADRMPAWLHESNIQYAHEPKLGGRRGKQPVDPSLNAGWVSPGFQNYADYTTTSEFRQGLDRLEIMAQRGNTAYMCAETLPWRCHRLLISNVLVSRGWNVHHIFPNGTITDHEFGKWGAVPKVADGGYIVYPKPDRSD